MCNGRLFSGAGLPPLRDSEPMGKKVLESNSLFNSTSPSGFRPKIRSAYPSSTHVTDEETPANQGRRSRRVWTDAEDARLAYAISLHSAKRSKPWRKIAYVVSSRNSKQCRYRWSQTSTTRSNNKIQSRLPASAAINASTPFSKCTGNDSTDLFCAFGRAIGGDETSVGFKQQHFSQRKRRLDFGDDAVSESSEDVDTIDVEDFVTTVDSPKNKFNVLVVDKVKTLSTSKKVRVRIGLNMGERGFACKKIIAVINMKLARV